MPKKEKRVERCSSEQVAARAPKSSRMNLRRLKQDLYRDRYLYLFLILPVVYFIIFRYIPMYGLKFAFQDYNPYDPASSEWVAFGQFEELFTKEQFTRALLNTLKISGLKILIGFPAPVILSLLLNEIRSMTFKRISQTTLYLPYFVSWVVMAGILMNLLDPTSGAITQAINRLTGRSVQILTDPGSFVPMLITSDVYKGMGWGTILYLAAISSIDGTLYEAAAIDGAGRFRQAISITLPSIVPTMFVVFTLGLGNILNAGFDQIFMLYNSLVYSVADIIDTYVYRIGITNADYSFSTAAGLFKSLVGLGLILGFNELSKRTVKRGLW